MNNVVTTPAPSFFDWIFFILTDNRDTHKISDGFEIGQDSIRDL